MPYLTKESVTKALNDIFSIQLNDNITFNLLKIEKIRDDDVYGGYRASINAAFDTLNVTLKIDLTTGDKITPKEVKYRFNDFLAIVESFGFLKIRAKGSHIFFLTIQ